MTLKRTTHRITVFSPCNITHSAHLQPVFWYVEAYNRMGEIAMITSIQPLSFPPEHFGHFSSNVHLQPAIAHSSTRPSSSNSYTANHSPFDTYQNIGTTFPETHFMPNLAPVPTQAQVPNPVPAPTPAPNSAPAPVPVSKTKHSGKSTARSATTRRSNVYLPNKRSAKHLWTHRKNSLTLDQLRSVAGTEAERAVLERTGPSKFEDLDTAHNEAWETFSRRLSSEEYAFKLLDQA